jgi:hypothetical protein
MRMKIHLLSLVTVCVLFTSCSTFHVGHEVTDSFVEMKNAGKLPGIASNDHGHFQTVIPLHLHITYPITLMEYGNKTGDTAQYIYTLTKDSPSSKWRLTAAWRTFPDGKHEDLMPN